MTTRNPRVVVDTSVLISAALFPGGNPRAAVNHVLQTGGVLLSKATFHELSTRLFRKKFNRYVHVGERGQFCRTLYHAAEWIAVTETITACRDPRDDKFLELAVSAEADLILSSDSDLLVLHPFRGIPILAPAAYLESIGASR